MRDQSQLAQSSDHLSWQSRDWLHPLKILSREHEGHDGIRQEQSTNDFCPGMGYRFSRLGGTFSFATTMADMLATATATLSELRQALLNGELQLSSAEVYTFLLMFIFWP